MTMLPDVEANTEPLWEGCALKLDFKKSSQINSKEMNTEWKKNHRNYEETNQHE